jgi:hypothetical protein
MTPIRQDLLQALGQIQNHPLFAHQDIMTITGCGMTDDEVRRHIDCQFSFIARVNFEKAQEEPRSARKAA